MTNPIFQWRLHLSGKGIVIIGLIAILTAGFIATKLVDLHQALDTRRKINDLYWLPSQMDRELGLLSEEAAMTLAKQPSKDTPLSMRIDFINNRLDDILNANFGSQKYLKAVDGFDAYINRLQALTAYLQDVKGRMTPTLLEEVIHKVAAERERNEAFAIQTRLVEQQYDEDHEARIQHATQTIFQLLVIIAGLLLMICIILYIETRRIRAQFIQRQQDSLAQSAVLAGISHEFRTPLQSIAANIQIVSKSLPPGNSASKPVQRLNASIMHLESIIDGLIDQAAICSNQLTLTYDRTDVLQVIHQVMEALNYRAEQRGLTLLADLQPLKPVITDEKRLRQILWNLLSNAMKYTDIGGVTVSANIQTDHSPVLIIVVKDTGVGIPDAFLKQVSPPFSQSPNKRGGTGLGLWLVKSLVEAMGGHFSIHSVMDAGTTLTAFIPVQLTEDPSDTTSAPRSLHVEVQA